MNFEWVSKSDLNTPILSIVLLTYNSCDDLGLCLSSIKKQSVDLSKIQVVIVDDGSVDATKATVMRYVDSLKIDFFVLEHTGIRGGNRNFGVSRAHADRILFIDGDMILSPDFVERHLKATAVDKSVISMGKRFRPFKTEEGRITPSIIENHFQILQHLPALDDERLLFELTINSSNLDQSGVFAMVFSHNICLWKEKFLAVGGFDEAFSKFWGAEDVELGYRLVLAGCKVKFDSRIVGYHLFRGEDIQKKIQQLKQNLRQFRGKHRTWDAELACIEHQIWPFRYLMLREQVRRQEHVVRPGKSIPPVEGSSVVFGVDFDGVRNAGAVVGLLDEPTLDGQCLPILGLFTPFKEKQFKTAWVSTGYLKYGEEFFGKILCEAERIADKVLLADDKGVTEESNCTSLRRVLKKRHLPKLLITVSDSNFGGNNKSFLYRLGLELSRVGVDIGFSLLGDVFEDRGKFNSFGDIEDVQEQQQILALFSHDKQILDGEIPNVMDGILGGGLSRSIGRRILWQEPYAIGVEEAFANESKNIYSQVIARRKKDVALFPQAIGVTPIGVDDDRLFRLAEYYKDRWRDKGVTFLWICDYLDVLSGLDDVLASFNSVKKNYPHVGLKLIVGSQSLQRRSEYLNDSAWHMLDTAVTLQKCKEDALLATAMQELEDQSNIQLFRGNFGIRFLEDAVAGTDILIDSSPNTLFRSWVLNAFAMNKSVVRFDDCQYADYEHLPGIFKFRYDTLSGSFGSLQQEMLAHGALSSSRYSLFKKARRKEMAAAMEAAIEHEVEAGPRANINGAFVEKYSWKKIALHFRDLVIESGRD